jgi:hypothetical protein
MENFETIIREITKLVRDVAAQASRDGYRNGVRAARTNADVPTEELLNRQKDDGEE